ncbi:MULTISPECIES: hypothetical protein [Bradyrhizobium]
MNVSASRLAATIVVALISAIFLTIEPPSKGGLSFGAAAAQARVGRPATPGSVAGVARRTSRRAVVGGAVVGGAVVAPVVRPRCGYHPYPPCY